MERHRFELVGGHAALDFLNTIHDWTVEAPRDYLGGPADAAGFGEQSGLLAPAEARRLERHDDGRGEVRRLRELRGTLERIFRAAASSMSPAQSDLDELSGQAARAAAAARLRPARGALVRRLEEEAASVALLRLRIAEAAVALLTSTQLARVKSCPSCGWFFLDTSKNRSRRWCSMRTCGGAAKAHRYYWRTRKRPR